MRRCVCLRVYTSFEKKESERKKERRTQEVERQERTLAIGWEIMGKQDIVRNGESERERER